MQGRRRTAVFLAPLAAGLGAVLLCLSGWGDRAGLGLYDILLRLRPAPERPRELLLVELDEATGSREWDGLGIAEGIATMAELGARYAVFPAPGTLDAAPGAKDAPSVPDLATAIDEEFSRIDENVAALFDAIKLGSVPPKESPRFVAELLDTIDAGKARLLDEAAGASHADRARLEAAVRLFDRAYFAVDPQSGIASRRSLPVEGARGRGSSRLGADPDGGRRRVVLAPGGAGGRYANVTLLALLDRLGGPTRAVSSRAITIKGASARASEDDIVIPLSRGGLLVDWPRPGRVPPRRLAWGELARAALLEKELADALRDMQRAGFLAPGGGALPGLYDYAAGLGSEALERGKIGPEWLEARERFFEQAARFLESQAEDELYASDELTVVAPGAPYEEEIRRLTVASSRETIRAAFAGARRTSEELGRLRARLKKELEGSFCVVAPSAAGAEGRTTPFGEAATEGLASVAVAGSILSGRFLRELPAPLGSCLGAALALAVALVGAKAGPRRAAIWGAVLALAAAAAAAALFISTGAYLSPLAPALGPAAAAAAAWLAGRRGGQPTSATPPAGA